MSNAKLSTLVLLAIGAVASGCGGGGGGGGDGSWLVFTPSRIEIQAYRGEVGAQLLEAESSRPLSGPLYVLYVLPEEVFGPGAEGPLGTDYFSYELRTRADAAVRTYEGSIEVRLCTDSACRHQIDGSPWHVPYAVTIRGPDLHPLEPIAGAQPVGAGGYVPATFDPAVFDRRFYFDPTLDRGPNIGSFAVGGGRLFVMTGPDSWPTQLAWELHAYSEATSELLWTHSFGEVIPWQPVVKGNRVHVGTRTEVWTFDAETGAVLNHAGLPPPEEPGQDRYFSGWLLSAGDGVLAGYEIWGSQTAGLARFGADGAFEGLIPTASRVPVVVWENQLVLPEYPAIAARDPATGDLLWSAAVSDWRWFDGGLKLLHEVGLLCTTAGTECLDLTTHEVASFQLPSGRTLLAAADGIVYAGAPRGELDANLGFLEAYDLATEELLWSWPSPGNIEGVILADGLAFVLTPSATEGLDLATRELVFFELYGGQTAISERGVLYVANRSGNIYAPRIMAWNLR